MTTVKEKVMKKYLNDFAQKNQYNNWKEVLKDKQSMEFTAKEFEDEALGIIQLTEQEKDREFSDWLKLIKRSHQNAKDNLIFKDIDYKIKELEELKGE